VFLEVVPFLCGRFSVFFAGPGFSTPGDVVAVVLDDLFAVDGDVALGGVQVQAH